MSGPLTQAREALAAYSGIVRDEQWAARLHAALAALIEHTEQVERERDEACAQMTAVIRRALEAALEAL